MKYLLCFLLSLGSFFTALQAQECASNSLYYLLVGSYTENGQSGKGIYVFEFNALSGELKLASIARDVANPSFLTASADGRFVYAVNELSGDREGMVSAFAFDKSKGTLRLLNQETSKGGDPCYLSLAADEKFLFVANYTGGSLSVLPIQEDGKLSPVSQHVQHTGSSLSKERQEAPHVHAVLPGPGNQHLYAVDLGTDRIHAYPLNKNSRQPLKVREAGIYQVLGGSGPRHLTFNKAGDRAYLVQELSGNISSYAVGKDGLFLPLQSLPLFPPSFQGKLSGAELKLSPDERFLYVSNRGEANLIACFAVQEEGSLKAVGYTSTRGKTPRNFLIEPGGRFLLVANQDSNSLLVFQRDTENGKLSFSGKAVRVGSPVYLLLLKR